MDLQALEEVELIDVETRWAGDEKWKGLGSFPGFFTGKMAERGWPTLRQGTWERHRLRGEGSLKHASALGTSGCSCPHASWVPTSGAQGRGGFLGADMKLMGVGGGGSNNILYRASPLESY